MKFKRFQIVASLFLLLAVSLPTLACGSYAPMTTQKAKVLTVKGHRAQVLVLKTRERRTVQVLESVVVRPGQEVKVRLWPQGGYIPTQVASKEKRLRIREQ